MVVICKRFQETTSDSEVQALPCGRRGSRRIRPGSEEWLLFRRKSRKPCGDTEKAPRSTELIERSPETNVSHVDLAARIMGNTLELLLHKLITRWICPRSRTS
ncbi:hypothetical protein GCM10027360_64530 [Amycolatopsis echigonensis]